MTSPLEDLFPTQPVLRPEPPPGLAWLMDHVRYKKGWTIRAAPTAELRGPGGGPWAFDWTVRISFPAEDAYGSGRVSEFVQDCPVPNEIDGDREALVHWLHSQICNAELHEAGEWFVVDGKRPFNPHRRRG